MYVQSLLRVPPLSQSLGRTVRSIGSLASPEGSLHYAPLQGSLRDASTQASSSSATCGAGQEHCSHSRTRPRVGVCTPAVGHAFVANVPFSLVGLAASSAPTTWQQVTSSPQFSRTFIRRPSWWQRTFRTGQPLRRTPRSRTHTTSGKGQAEAFRLAGDRSDSISSSSDGGGGGSGSSSSGSSSSSSSSSNWDAGHRHQGSALDAAAADSEGGGLPTSSQSANAHSRSRASTGASASVFITVMDADAGDDGCVSDDGDNDADEEGEEEDEDELTAALIGDGDDAPFWRTMYGDVEGSITGSGRVITHTQVLSPDELSKVMEVFEDSVVNRSSAYCSSSGLVFGYWSRTPYG